MKAITHSKYGGPSVLSIQEQEIPTITSRQILVKVEANSVNPADWHIMRGQPFMARLAFGLFRPKQPILGCDFAGEVVEVGAEVTRFQKGDYVFGESLKGGAFAEYTAVDESVCAQMPTGAKWIDFACLPIAGLTAYQAILTHGNLSKNESVLINGSSGGVGHFAVQIAALLGAQVTAVCSAKNAEFVKSLGAHSVVAYDQENIHEHAQQYDLVVDIHGNLHHSDFTRMGKRGVLVGFTTFSHMAKVLLSNALSKFKLAQFTAHPNPADLEQLARWKQQNRLQPSIENVYSFDEVPTAIAYIEQMKTKGKVAISWS